MWRTHRAPASGGRDSCRKAGGSRYDLPRLWEGLAHQRPRGVFRIASKWATRDSLQDRCLARLGLGARRVRSLLGCPPGLRVWLTTGLRPVGHRDEVWLKKGLPCS
jgi:hypothetical protein